MGLNNSNDGRKTYLNIVGGKFARSVKEGTEGAVARTNKKDAVVYELLYDSLENVTINRIEKKIGDYGASWEVALKEVDEEFVLNLPYSGRIANGLLFRLPNIDFSRPLTLKLFTNKEGKTFMTAYDSATEEKIEAAYTKDNPNGLPPLETRKVKGVDTWDDTKQMEFIEHVIETNVQPRLKSGGQSEPSFGNPQIDNDLMDDLPF